MRLSDHPRRPMPRFLKPCFWSYDFRRLDRLRHAETVITQVLNYGDWRMVRWLLDTYEPSTMRYVVGHPHRGMWFPQALTLWTMLYGIKLPWWLRHAAIRELDPARRDWTAMTRYMAWRRRVKPIARVVRFKR